MMNRKLLFLAITFLSCRLVALGEPYLDDPDVVEITTDESDDPDVVEITTSPEMLTLNKPDDRPGGGTTEHYVQDASFKINITAIKEILSFFWNNTIKSIDKEITEAVGTSKLRYIVNPMKYFIESPFKWLVFIFRFIFTRLRLPNNIAELIQSIEFNGILNLSSEKYFPISAKQFGDTLNQCQNLQLLSFILEIPNEKDFKTLFSSGYTCKNVKQLWFEEIKLEQTEKRSKVDDLLFNFAKIFPNANTIFLINCKGFDTIELIAKLKSLGRAEIKLFIKIKDERKRFLYEFTPESETKKSEIEEFRIIHEKFHPESISPIKLFTTEEKGLFAVSLDEKTYSPRPFKKEELLQSIITILANPGWLEPTTSGSDYSLSQAAISEALTDSNGHKFYNLIDKLRSRDRGERITILKEEKETLEQSKMIQTKVAKSATVTIKPGFALPLRAIYKMIENALSDSNIVTFFTKQMLNTTVFATPIMVRLFKYSLMRYLRYEESRLEDEDDKGDEEGEEGEIEKEKKRREKERQKKEEQLDKIRKIISHKQEYALSTIPVSSMVFDDLTSIAPNFITVKTAMLEVFLQNLKHLSSITFKKKITNKKAVFDMLKTPGHIFGSVKYFYFENINFQAVNEPDILSLTLLRFPNVEAFYFKDCSHTEDLMLPVNDAFNRLKKESKLTIYRTTSTGKPITILDIPSVITPGIRAKIIQTIRAMPGIAIAPFKWTVENLLKLINLIFKSPKPEPVS